MHYVMYFLWLLICYLFLFKSVVLKKECTEAVGAAVVAIVISMFHLRPWLQLLGFIAAYVIISAAIFITELIYGK